MDERRKIELVLEYQNYIEAPPVKPKQLYGNACASDTLTIDSWRTIWIENAQKNHAHLGSFEKYGAHRLFGVNQNKPAIVVGSGPSLGYNGHLLKDRGNILALSCLHNFHFFEDREIPIDYYVSLDAGEVVLEEIAEGGAKSEAEYWEATKTKKLIAFIGSPPELLKKWKGELFVFNCPIPDQRVIEAHDALEAFNCYVSNGGNVLGACLYIAKAFMGSNPISYVGADFAFGHNSGQGHKFHSWDSKYDAKIGNVLRGVDVFGNKTLTWPSYYNFKNFFDYVALTVPGIYFNCTEGGLLGAYPEGNLMAIRQATLKEFIGMYRLNERLRASCENPKVGDRVVLY